MSGQRGRKETWPERTQQELNLFRRRRHGHADQRGDGLRSLANDDPVRAVLLRLDHTPRISHIQNIAPRAPTQAAHQVRERADRVGHRLVAPACIDMLERELDPFFAQSTSASTARGVAPMRVWCAALPDARFATQQHALFRMSSRASSRHLLALLRTTHDRPHDLSGREGIDTE
eukprot:3171148-Rhodomonas_salina.1